MSITRVSLAELLAQPHELSAEENAFAERVADEELHRNALADPDARPWTDEMFRQARADRRRRLASAEAAVDMSTADFALEEADAGQDLPIWAVMDEQGRTVFIQAAHIDRAAPRDGARTFKIVPSGPHKEP